MIGCSIVVRNRIKQMLPGFVITDESHEPKFVPVDRPNLYLFLWRVLFHLTWFTFAIFPRGPITWPMERVSQTQSFANLTYKRRCTQPYIPCSSSMRPGQKERWRRGGDRYKRQHFYWWGREYQQRGQWRWRGSMRRSFWGAQTGQNGRFVCIGIQSHLHSMPWLLSLFFPLLPLGPMVPFLLKREKLKLDKGYKYPEPLVWTIFGYPLYIIKYKHCNVHVLFCIISFKELLSTM